MRGNIVMKGYHDDPEATAEAFRGGWFHSGDLAVMHPDGYIELRDRKKDIIISGGENISTIEVEQALCAGTPPSWSAPSSPSRTSTGASGRRRSSRSSRAQQATADELIAFCREHLAHFKCPVAVRIRRAAEDLDRQGAEVRPAGAGVGRVRQAHPLRRADERSKQGRERCGSR